MSRPSLRIQLNVLSVVGVALLAVPVSASGGQTNDTVTFTREIAPILQRSCQSCHRPNSVAPMSLITYEDVRPWARSIKNRTGLRDRMGVMPPWFIEKDVGIQDYKDDISLSDAEIGAIAAWVDSGAPRGNPTDMPPPRVFAAADEWAIGEPDLIVDTPSISLGAQAPDWWGSLEPAPSGMTEDRYVAALQIKEVSDVVGALGGRFVFHHAVWATVDSEGNPSRYASWPIHEVGRNADFFDPLAGPLLRAGDQLFFNSVHMHANGQDTTANLRVGFKFHPKDYEPQRQNLPLIFGTSDIDLRGMEAGQEVHFYHTLRQHTKLSTFEPHMHAAGVRMCLESIWGGFAQTLSCAGYDHNWVKVYKYEDDAVPLLPKGTLLHVTAYFDNTPSNRNVIDPRNWSGLGHRSIDNMAVLIAPAIALTEEEFQEEIRLRRERLHLAKGEAVLGCPLCGFEELPGTSRVQAGGQD